MPLSFKVVLSLSQSLSSIALGTSQLTLLVSETLYQPSLQPFSIIQYCSSTSPESFLFLWGLLVYRSVGGCLSSCSGGARCGSSFLRPLLAYVGSPFLVATFHRSSQLLSIPSQVVLWGGIFEWGFSIVGWLLSLVIPFQAKAFSSLWCCLVLFHIWARLCFLSVLSLLYSHWLRDLSW